MVDEVARPTFMMFVIDIEYILSNKDGRSGQDGDFKAGVRFFLRFPFLKMG